MDASAYLKRQGWRGDGHSLDRADRGIRKPLLVSKKVGALGVGSNKHAPLSDQWWLRAFDQGLKKLGSGQESVLGSVQKHGVYHGGLYGRFVQGDTIAGSIGQTPPAWDPTNPTGASEPIEKPSHRHVNMAIDIPPQDKLERVVGKHPDKNSHDAMMHLLQNPNEAPASMKKMLERKRKRAERPVEKRARRKTEQTLKAKQEAKERREQAVKDRTWDAEKEAEKRRTRELNRQADQIVLEAQKRGIIPLGPNEIRNGIVPSASGANAITSSTEAQDRMQKLLDQVRLDNQSAIKGSGKKSLKSQKYAREKMKRELKRAAKAHLSGEEPLHEQTRDERGAKQAVKETDSAQKKADVAKRDAERLAVREERAAQKEERRATRAAENAKISRIIEERDAALKAGDTTANPQAAANGDLGQENWSPATTFEVTTVVNDSTNNDFDLGANEIKLGVNRRGGKKKIPGVGAVERYPTKAEKKSKKLKAMAIREGITDEEMQARLDAEVAKKREEERAKIDNYRAMKHGMNLEGYRDALAKGLVHTPAVEKKKIPPEKLQQYQQRAAAKGVKLEDYIRRREEKAAASVSEKLGNPFQQDILEAAKAGAEVIVTDPEQFEPSGGAGFVVDTEGDDDLTKFQDKTQALISQGKPLAILDMEGDDAYSYAPNMPVPLDPRIWEGKNVKDLPKHIRKARRDWMAARREEKKSGAVEGGSKPAKKKSKGQRKVEAREAFVKQILWHSRKHDREGGSGSNMVTIDGVENVPLVKLETKEGMFKKGEISLARTVARRVLRTVKREEKAKKGKGKGWKKRERAAKEAARNAGISGFTDKARLDPLSKTNTNLLL